MGSYPNHCSCVSFERIRTWYCKFIHSTIAVLHSTKLNDRPDGRVVTGSSLSGKSEVQILGQSNQTQCWERLVTAAIFLRKEQSCLGARTRRWALQTRYALQRNTMSLIERKIWFWFDEVKWQLKSHAQKNIKVLGKNSTTKHTPNY